MIVIAGTIDVDPTRRAEALTAAEPLMTKTRGLSGCLDYVWSADPLVDGRIYVFERWVSREALEAHFASPHYVEMRDTIAARGITGLDVSKYQIGRIAPVYDATGQPSAVFDS